MGENITEMFNCSNQPFRIEKKKKINSEYMK